MLKRTNPEDVPKPGTPYSQSVEAAPGMRWLHISGQVGVVASGKVLDGAEAQIEQIWKNLHTCMKAAGMGPHDLVKINALRTRAADIPLSRVILRRLLDGASPAQNMLVHSGRPIPTLIRT